MSRKKKKVVSSDITDLRENPGKFTIYGEDYIEGEALNQMVTAMKLPVSVKGALMPDAHTGYGLPIGGVLAVKNNVVIPYAVGVDIACRMCMSIFDLPSELVFTEKKRLKQLLGDHTTFGVGSTCKDHLDNSVFDKPEWNQVGYVKKMKDLAWSQLGTSGGGNHFAEWGVLEVLKDDFLLIVPPGKYLALLTHSGSRGFGSQVAEYYSKLAMAEVSLPQGAKHLAWLELDSEAGQEYWLAMNLAGDYASANHHEIHTKIARDLLLTPLMIVENHHNFAWKERLIDGTEVIVHRKGATPAGKNNIGIIPGSMVHHGFIIRGKGNEDSINSASHGAGRIMSRTAAFKNINREEMYKYLKDCGVELIGCNVDEAPLVYKDIDRVMSLQSDLVDILARFTPKIVRMAEPERWSRKWSNA